MRDLRAYKGLKIKGLRGHHKGLQGLTRPLRAFRGRGGLQFYSGCPPGLEPLRGSPYLNKDSEEKKAQGVPDAI